MLERLCALFIKRWHIVLALTALFCVFGWDRFQRLPIEAFPDVTDPMVEVVAVYPGQAAEEVERRITTELERVLAGTPGLIRLRSASVFGLSLLTLTFDDHGTDMGRRTLVAERLREASLPDGVEALMGPQATPVGQIYRYTLTGPRSLRELRALQDFVVERRLRAVPGVADVVTFGGFERQYQVRVDPERLAAAGVSALQVHEALAQANANAGGGYVAIGEQEFIVRGLGAAQDLEQLGAAVIREEDGVPLHIRDVAELVESSTPRRGAVGRGHNDEVVEGIVLLRRGENPSVVLAALHERVAQLNDAILPRDVKLKTFYDRTALVDATLATVGKNMLEGILLLLAVVYLFLATPRAVVIIALVVPISMLSAFVGLSLMGLSANLISLGAMDFGILVDGAIIVVEAALHALEAPDANQRDRASLLARAVASVARPVAFAMLIIIVALGPIFSLERVEGRIFSPMAYTYAFALLGALICAMVVVPAMQAVLLRGELHIRSPRWLGWVTERYAALLAALRPVRWPIFGAALLVVSAMGTYASQIGSEFLPELNEGGLYITAIFPSTIALNETQAQVRVLRDSVLESPEVTDVLSHIGRPEGSTQIEGPNNAELFVMLAPQRAWRPGLDKKGLEAELRGRLERIPGVQYNFSQPITDRVFETISGIIGQVVIKIRGSDLDAMTALAAQIQEQVNGVDGVTDLSVYQAGSIPSLRITLDREALARRGLSIEDVQQTIRIALGGEVATEVWEGERRFSVALKLPDTVRTDLRQLGQLRVGESEDAVTLAELASFDMTQGRASIWREDLTRFVALKFNVRGRDLGGVVADAQRSIEALPRPEGTYITWSGEFENQQRAMKRLSLTLPLALLVILGILFMQFRRVRPTLLIAAFIPVAALSALVGLRVLGESFSVSSAVGCIALLGQMVLSGVVLCARINEARGAPDPMIEGARQALRPILLTTTLAALGLVPAALSHAMGSETQRPFAISIVAGLLIATPALLLLLPLLYAGEPPARRREEPASAAPTASVVLGALVAALLLPAPVSAQQRFTLEEALRQSAQRPEIASAKALEQAARAQIDAAGRWSNPELSADYVQGVARSSYDPLGTAILGVEQQIETSGLPTLRRDAAREAARAASAQRQRVERRVALDVEAALIELALQDQLVEEQRVLLERIQEAERIIVARVKAGAAARYDAHRIAIARAIAEAELESAEADRALLHGQLMAAVGPGAAALVGAPALPEARALGALDGLQEQARTSPALLQAMADAAEARAAIAIARAEVFPGISVRVMAGFGQGPGQWDLGLGVSAPLPLLNDGSGAIEAAEQRALAARRALEASEIALRRTVQTSHETAVAQREALERFMARVGELQDTAVAEATAQYREGGLSALELLDAFTLRTTIQRQRIQLERAARLAELRTREALLGE